MPTGLTYQLEEMNYDLKKWFLECIVRQFGLCNCLRGKTSIITQSEILEALRNLDVKPKKPVEMTEQQLEKKYKDNQQYLKEEIKNRIEKAIFYKKAVDKVQELIDRKGNSEMFSAILLFAKEQLEMIKSDYRIDYLEDKQKVTFEQFKEKTKEVYEHNLKCYEEDLKEFEATNEDEYFQTYKALIEEVEEVFSDDTFNADSDYIETA